MHARMHTAVSYKECLGIW